MAQHLLAEQNVMSNKRRQRRCLVVACGALAKEIVALRSQLALARSGSVSGPGALGSGEEVMTLQCLPAGFHNTPGKIAPAVEEILRDCAHEFDSVFVAYGECGTGGALDDVLKRYGASRMTGAHCYEFYAGGDLYEQIIEEQIGSFFLTDYLVKNFDRLIITGLGLDRFPHLRDDYFGNYTQLVYLSQTKDAALLQKAFGAADRLGLELRHIHVGYGGLASELEAVTKAVAKAAPGKIAPSPQSIEQLHVRG